jgi:valyl-tRNA synthetase
MSKTEISNPKSKAGVMQCLLYTLETSLKLLHPFMPFVTEEIWQNIKQLSAISYQLKAKSIVISDYPRSLPRDHGAEKEMALVIEAITGIRTVRGELNISPSVEVNVLIETFSGEVSGILRANLHYIKKLSRTADVTIGEDIKKPADSAVCVKDFMEVYIPIKGLLNIDAEIDKLIKESRKVEEAMAFIDRKLMNEDFLKKAPEDVVEKEKAKHGEFAAKKERIEENINKFKAAGSA